MEEMGPAWPFEDLWDSRRKLSILGATGTGVFARIRMKVMGHPVVIIMKFSFSAV